MPQPTATRSQTDPRTFATHAARLLADSRCDDVRVLDVRSLSQVTDFFVIASGTSDRQIRSVGGDVEQLAALEGYRALGVQGRESAQWVVVDFVDVVVHLFAPESRAYYDLESLWGDAAKVDWQSATTPGQFSKITGKKGTE